MSHSSLRRAACVVAAILSAASLVAPTFADTWSSYNAIQNYQCHRWSSSGVCTDWSYYQEKTPLPAYGGTAVQPWSMGTSYYWYGRPPCYPDVDCTGSVTISAQGSPSTVYRGGWLTYTIYIRNNDSQTRIVSVTAKLDASTSFATATFSGRNDGNAVMWGGLSLPARASKTLQLRVLVRPDALLGNTIALHVQSGNSTDVVTTSVAQSPYSYSPYYQPNPNTPYYPYIPTFPQYQGYTSAYGTSAYGYPNYGYGNTGYMNTYPPYGTNLPYQFNCSSSQYPCW